MTAKGREEAEGIERDKDIEIGKSKNVLEASRGDQSTKGKGESSRG